MENAVISNNILDTNGRSYGAGMYLDTSNVIMNNVSIINNKGYGTSFSLGGGMYITNSNPVMTNVLIASNYLYKPSGSPTGGGIYVGGTSTLNIMNSTIADNYASTASINGSGIYNSATVNLTNTILWNEQGSSSEIAGSGTTNATYSDIRGGLTGTGNIDLLPNFFSASNYDLLASSPCIDAGTTAGAPADDIEGTLRDARPDIGAYEGPLATNLPTTNEN